MTVIVQLPGWSAVNNVKVVPVESEMNVSVVRLEATPTVEPAVGRLIMSPLGFTIFTLYWYLMSFVNDESGGCIGLYMMIDASWPTPTTLGEMTAYVCVGILS